MAIILDGTLGETFPSWTTAGRPASPSVSQMGYNSTLGNMEYWNGSVCRGQRRRTDSANDFGRVCSVG